MLEAFSQPRGVAVWGVANARQTRLRCLATTSSSTATQGPIYPINPKATEILGLPAYASVRDIPGPVDLAVVLVPAQAVPAVIEECGQKGIGGAVVISAGFREVGREGRRSSSSSSKTAHRLQHARDRPQCPGHHRHRDRRSMPRLPPGMPRRGRIAFMSQSGALCTAVLDMALGQGIGFSRFYSIGNKADLNEIDFLRAWAADPETNVIVGYLEGISNGPEFMRVARKVTRQKPIVAIKSGTTSAGSRAVSSHTGTLAGSERAYDAAFKQVGIIRAGSVQDLFDVAQAFADQPLPQSDAVAVITNAGGPGIMASDAIERVGMRLASLTPETQQKLRAGAAAGGQRSQPYRRARRCRRRPLCAGDRDGAWPILTSANCWSC